MAYFIKNKKCSGKKKKKIMEAKEEASEMMVKNTWSDAAREAAKRKRQSRQRSKYKAHDLNDQGLAKEHRKQVSTKVEQKRYGGSYKKRLAAMTDDQLLGEKFDPRYTQGKTDHRATMVHREMKRRGAQREDF